MLLAPARTNALKIPTALPYSLPAPVGGINSQDALADMPEEDAVGLDNFFPQPDFVELRRGHTSHATGIGGAVEALMEWAGPASRKLKAAKSTAIYDVTSAGAVGAAEVSSLTNGRWQHVMMATSGGNFLIICNGADSVRSYDGTSWATPAITGVTSSTLINVAIHKERLWFVETNKVDAWYLPVQSIAGAAVKFPLGSVFKEGGKLQAIGTITRDGGAGSDDYAAFVSSRGEVAVYAGTDPASASTWALVGLFYIPPPIGHRCLQKAGGDLTVITEGGVISLSSMLALDRTQSERAAITSKINRLFMADARDHRGKFGWQSLGYPRSNMIIVNVPITEGALQRQYVMNALTGAWGKFNGLNGGCWGLLSEDLYFGGNSGTVWKADNSFQDNGGGIQGDLKGAFSYFKQRGRQKLYTAIRPLFSSSGAPGILMGLNVDFEDMEPTSSVAAGTSSGSTWDSGLWDSAVWGAGDVITKNWQGLATLGTAGAARLRVVANGASFRLYGFDVLYQPGGPI